MITQICCPLAVVDHTLTILHAGGGRRCEALALWLGRRRDGRIEVVEAYEPPYRSSIDFFHITPDGMRAVMAHLRQRRLFICAQVHSHPGPAFHSKADDEWAIVRHEGALSLVLPHFASSTTPANFLDQAATFRLAAGDRWIEVPGPELNNLLEICDAYGTPGK